MQKNVLKQLSCLIFIAIIGTSSVMAQRVFVNTNNAFYELTGGAGSCSYVAITNPCVPNFPGNVYSMAVYKDTIYYLDGSTLRSFTIGVAGSCRTYGTVGTYSSMTVDPNGILYFASNFLASYNPYTFTYTNLGALPFSSAGDLFFFNNKLLLAGKPAAIYEINIANPAASTLYMNTNGIGFYGLLSYPVVCGNSRYFGLAPDGIPVATKTILYELDLVNKTVMGVTCEMPGLDVYDAGSTTEGGINAGINISKLTIAQPCPPAITAVINIQAIPIQGFTTTYSIDNGVANTTGQFNNIAQGTHTIHIASSACTLDTIIKISTGLNSLITVQKTDATNCAVSDGTILLTATSNHLPITYTLLSSGQQRTDGNFAGMAAGTHIFTIKDAAGCSRDTTVILNHNASRFVESVTTFTEHCDAKNGSIVIKIAGDDSSNVLTSLANGNFLPQMRYYNLASGSYTIQIKKPGECPFDTTVIIGKLSDVKPTAAVQINHQICVGSNGSIGITATAPGFLYQYQLNGAGYGNNNMFTNLNPGNYRIGIRNQNGCQWDSTVTVLPYKIAPFIIAVDSSNPSCKEPLTGSLQVIVSGGQQPFTLFMNGNVYTNGQLIQGLTNKLYKVIIKNMDGCSIDSVSRNLILTPDPSCSNIYVPNIFTPNNDTKNDLFKIGWGYDITEFHLRIFNRYGQLVFATKDKSKGWDGTFKGASQPPGNYVWMMQYKTMTNNNVQVLRGTVLVIR